MSYIKPRHGALLIVPVFGETRQKDEQAKGTDVQEIPVRVRRASLTLNDHNHADELEISLEWRDAGIDPRFLKNASVKYFMGDANVFSADDIPHDDDTLRFTGIATKIRRIAKEDMGFVVDMSFQDYTTLFLHSKPFPAEGIPLYSETLQQGWERICDHTGWDNPDKAGPNKIESNVAALRNSIVFEGDIDQSKTFGSVVPERYQKLAKFDSSIEPTADAWAVWSKAVGSLGLITFIRMDTCVVTTSAAYYINDPTDKSRPKPPVFIWGKNIKSFEETAHSEFEGKGVCITSYDYKNGATLEAFYPRRTDLSSPIQTKRVVAQKRKNADPAIRSNRYDFIEYNGVTDPDILLAIAKRAYDERSRQELSGTLRTAELWVEAADTGLAEVDILGLRSGDEITIGIEPFNLQTLQSLGDTAAQLEYLKSRNYNENVANLIIRNMKAFATLTPTFHVRSIHMILDTDNDGGTLEVDINFCNRITVDGDIKKDEDIRTAPQSQ